MYSLNTVLMGGGGKIHYTVPCIYSSDWKVLDCIDSKALLLQRMTHGKFAPSLAALNVICMGRMIYLDKLSIFFYSFSIVAYEHPLTMTIII